MSRTVLVLGGTGFLGRAIASALAGDGHRVFAGVRVGRDLPTELTGLATPLTLSDDTVVACRDALLASGSDIVVDAAWHGVASGDRDDEAVQHRNVLRTEAWLRALGDSEVRAWVGLGSQAEYGPVTGLVREDLPLQPTSRYGAAKAQIQTRLQQGLTAAGVRHAWLRIFAAYGPGQQRGWLVRDALDSMLVNEPVALTRGVQRHDYLFVGDVARAVASVVDADQASGVFNVGAGEAISVREIVEAAKLAAGSSSPLLFGALPDPAGEPACFAADISKLRATTGWQPETDLAVGLHATVTWLRDLGTSNYG